MSEKAEQIIIRVIGIGTDGRQAIIDFDFESDLEMADANRIADYKANLKVIMKRLENDHKTHCFYHYDSINKLHIKFAILRDQD